MRFESPYTYRVPMGGTRSGAIDLYEAADEIGLVLAQSCSADTSDAEAVLLRISDVLENLQHPPRTSVDRLREFKNRTDLTWDQVAALMGVSKRAVLLWQRGGRMSAPKEQRLGRLLAALPAGPPESVHDWLFSPEGNSTRYDRLVGSPQLVESFTSWIDRQPIA